jgi:hypothetical protein
MRLSWGRAVVGGLLVVLGAVWLLQEAGVIEFPLRALTPLALIGIGIGLVVGARQGSYPWLIAVGVVLTLLLAIDSPNGGVATSDRFPLAPSVNHVERPLESSELRPYRIDTGRLTIDLTRLALDERTYRVSARVGAGQLVVIIPEGVPIKVRARSGVGNVRVPGDESSGIGANEVFEAPGFDDARPRFDLDLRVGVGSIRVTQGQRVPVDVSNDSARRFR